MGMLAWLVIGVSIGWLRESLRLATTPAQATFAIGVSVLGALVGGLVAGMISEGQLDLEWQTGGAVGGAVGVVFLPVWLRA